KGNDEELAVELEVEGRASCLRVAVDDGPLPSVLDQGVYIGPLGLPQEGEYFRFGRLPALDLLRFARVEVGLVLVERAGEIVTDEHGVPEVEPLSPSRGHAANQRGSPGRVGVAQTL